MENKVKKCTMCGRMLTLDRFKRVSHAKDGHASHCKDCANVKRREKLENKVEDGAIIRDVKGGGGNPELAKFNNRELLEEIRFRGYKGKLQIVREVVI